VDGSFGDRAAGYVDRVERCLDRALPPADLAPTRLHEAMRYAVLNGGKRVRPMLVYAAGECVGASPGQLDPAATAIELIHAFSLVHDDLPAMDDDDLRRGLPTVHRRFDEATAILAADALQPLAFGVIAGASELSAPQKVALAGLIAEACGSLGMTGGQAIDVGATGSLLGAAELEAMHAMKTGALIHASVMSACCVADALSDEETNGMDAFGRHIGLAFQIRDDLLDVEGATDVIGKRAGADAALGKPTWPALFGVEQSRARCAELLDAARASLGIFGDRAESLLWLARLIVERSA